MGIPRKNCWPMPLITYWCFCENILNSLEAIYLVDIHEQENKLLFLLFSILFYYFLAKYSYSRHRVTYISNVWLSVLTAEKDYHRLVKEVFPIKDIPINERFGNAPKSPAKGKASKPQKRPPPKGRKPQKRPPPKKKKP